MISRIDPLELSALVRIVDDLNYYQLLGLEPGAGATRVKEAYHNAARSLHPDANRHLNDQQKLQSQTVSKRVSEAYSILRDPRRRQTYDAHLKKRGAPRLQMAELKKRLRNHELSASRILTTEGRQFWERACMDLSRYDWPAAIRNLQTALTFEPESALFQNALKQARDSSKNHR